MTWSRNLRSGLHTRILSLLLVLCASGAWAQSEVYRIVVQQGIPEKEAQDFKLHMEGLGFVPVILGDFSDDGKASVFYGNFANKPEAEKARAELKRSSISAVAVVSVKPSRDESSGGGNSYTIVVSSFRQRSEADALAKKLGQAGQIGVKVVSQANVYYVTVGKYGSRDTARNVVASLKNEGHDKADVVEQTSDGALRVTPPTDGSGGSDVDISKIVGELGSQLSDKQKDEVAKLIEEKVRLATSSGGGTDAATAARLRELENRLGSLDTKVQQVAAEVEAEKTRREQAARQTVEVGSLMRDGETLAKAGKYDDAIVKMELILKLDPNNNLAEVRKRTFQEIKDGGGAMGGGDSDGQYNRQKAEAVKLVGAGDRSNLQMAKTIWITIKGLNEKYADEADAAIAQINTQIAALPSEAPVAKSSSLAVIISAAAAVTVLLLGVVFFLRSRKERREILMKIQAATELRPTMKGIPGGRRASDWQLMAPEGSDAPAGGPAMGGAMSGMGGGSGSMDDLFDSGEGEADPLGGMGRAHAAPPPARPKTPLSTPAASDMGFDDILGGGGGGFDPGFGGFDSPSPAPARPAPSRPAPAPAMATGGDLDDILAGLGGSAPAAAPAPSGGDFSFGDIFAQPEAPSKPVARNAPAHAEAGSLSLDDLLGGGANHAAPAAGGAGAFDFLGGASPSPGGANAFGGTPFDGLLGGSPKPLATDDFPAMGRPDSAPLTGFGIGDETIIERPSLDFGGGGRATAAAAVAEAPVGANGEVYRQDFSADVPGMKPAGWQGDYAYSRLVVENDTPPPGSSNYLVYDKKDGVGKVYYATRFPNVSGVVSVEFDLRCDDKNKFLLGFYVEKDEDFQQSIHTKILRSESQTAPSIHIHGQPAPYMLGAWAHIKYVIDLNEGKVDGFVDDRHVARGVTLTQVPKYLNTLAIRDNINTTGKLFIGNVVVRKLG